MKKLSVSLLVVLLLSVFVACEDEPGLEEFGIAEYAVGKDTLTIEFNRDIGSFSPPRFLTIGEDEYDLDVYQDMDTVTLFRLGHYGLLDQTSNSLTLAILGDFNEQLADGEFNVKVYTGDPLEPDVVYETENFRFAAWSGTDSEVSVIGSYPNSISFSVLADSAPITGLGQEDFTLFSLDGTMIDYTLETHATDPMLPEHEYQMEPVSGTFSGYYYVRFAKTGYNPDNAMVMIEEAE